MNGAYHHTRAEEAFPNRPIDVVEPGVANRRRLDAESLRDATLAVAGKLDAKMGGPGYWDFVLEKPEHSPHYEYDKQDPDDPKTHRRSIYRFIVRSAPDPFMECLDCADPSQLVDKRNETQNALSALALLNNKFMLRMSEHFAARVNMSAKSTPEKITAAFRLALTREPTAEELRADQPCLNLALWASPRPAATRLQAVSLRANKAVLLRQALSLEFRRRSLRRFALA